MTPKEKAKELVDKFKYNTRAWNETNGWHDCFYNAKQCALLSVDEVLEDTENIYFWHEVKSEIEAL